MHQGYGGDETQQVVEAEKYQALEGQVRALIERVKALKGQNKSLKDQTRATEADRARLKAQVDDLQQVGQMRFMACLCPMPCGAGAPPSPGVVKACGALIEYQMYPFINRIMSS